MLPVDISHEISALENVMFSAVGRSHGWVLLRIVLISPMSLPHGVAVVGQCAGPLLVPSFLQEGGLLEARFKNSPFFG